MNEGNTSSKGYWNRFHKLLISVIAGLLGLYFSPYSISIQLDEIVINLPWSILFPIIVSIGFGWRYAIIASLSGGALFPFLLWANNGWTNFFTFLCFLINYSIVGLINEPFLIRKIQSSFLRLILLTLLAVFFFWVYYFFLFNPGLSINPPFWTNNTINYLDPEVLHGFFIKDSINFIAMAGIAYTLFRLPVVRRIFSMQVYPYMHSNNRIFIFSLFVSVVIWLAFVVLGKFLLINNNQLQQEHVSLAFLVIITGGYIVAGILIYYSENQLKARFELNKSEQNFRKLIEFSPIPMAVVNNENRLIILNRAFEDTYGYNISDLPAIEDWFTKAFPQKPYRLFVMKFWEKIKENTNPDSLLTPVQEFLMTCKNGELKNVEVSAYVEDVYVICSFTDFTIRKKAEQELIEARNKAEESDRLKTAFLQNMSHEIRTPMNAIMGFSEILPMYYSNKEKLEKYSSIITQRSRDLLDIINDILDIAKIESGQLPVYQENCNLRELFSELTDFFTEYRNRNNKQHIQFNLKAFDDEEMNKIRIDKGKLKQIFINLISNAFKFTSEGTIEGGCSLTGNNTVLFYVSDTGIGIPENKQKLIFERFMQLSNPTRGSGGTGLGLPIVKGLVTLLGGEVFLQSEQGKGSHFSFTIPLKE